MLYRALFLCLLLVLTSCENRLDGEAGLAPLAIEKFQALRRKPPPTNSVIEDADKFILPPEYEPARAVLLSERILWEEGGQELIKALQDSDIPLWFLTHNPEVLPKDFQTYTGEAFSAQNKSLLTPTDSIWIRDYGPLTTVPTLTYSGPKVDYKVLNSFYYPERRLDGRVSRRLPRLLESEWSPIPNLTVVSATLPVAFEGGNMMCQSQHCFISGALLEANIGQSFQDQIYETEEDILKVFKAQLHQQFKVVGRMPLESTGHIDMWAKFLNDTTLLIHQLPEEALQSLPPDEQAAMREIQTFLKEQSTGKDAQGKLLPHSLYHMAMSAIPNLKVVVIPMPAPFLDEDILVARSYTNALLVNGYALVPRYEKSILSTDYPDQYLIKGYEQKVTKAYREAGFQLKWVNSDYYIVNGGAVHCVTMQVPQTASKFSLSALGR